MKYAFIAGSESGLAKAAIKRIENRGYFIFASDISYKEIECFEKRVNIPIDLTDDESIRSALEYVRTRTDSLDLISSFAGIVTLGSFVELDMDALDRIIAINCLAPYKLNNVFFPLLENAKGRIVIISSEYGKLDALPIHGYYGVAKHALEVYGDSLRRELQKSGVKVAILRPGAFRTAMQGGIEKQFDKLINETVRYKRILTLMRGLVVGELKKAKDPEVFASVFEKAAFSPRPRRYYRVNNSIKMKLLSVLPSFIQDWIFRLFL